MASEVGSVQRYEPVHEDAIAADADGRYVLHADYEKLAKLYAVAWEECEAWREFDNEPDTLTEYRDHDRLRAEMGLE